MSVFNIKLFFNFLIFCESRRDDRYGCGLLCREKKDNNDMFFNIIIIVYFITRAVWFILQVSASVLVYSTFYSLHYNCIYIYVSYVPSYIINH